MVKIIIPIQSISDIITNSSSEIFAYIHSEHHLKQIYTLIDRLFGWNQESEITPCVELKDKLEESEWRSEEELKSYPNKWVEIEFPYCLDDCKEFYRVGLEAILDEKIGNNNYVIIYNED